MKQMCVTRNFVRVMISVFHLALLVVVFTVMQPDDSEAVHSGVQLDSVPADKKPAEFELRRPHL